MEYKYLLLVILKNNKIESYFANNSNALKEYAELKKFTRYEIYELKKVEEVK